MLCYDSTTIKKARTQSMVKELTYTEYKQNPGVSDGITVIDFYRSDCGPCKAVAPEIEKVSEARKDIKVFSVNAEEEPELAEEFRVMATPTILILKDKAVKKKFMGFKSADSITSIVETIEG